MLNCAISIFNWLLFVAFFFFFFALGMRYLLNKSQASLTQWEKLQFYPDRDKYSGCFRKVNKKKSNLGNCFMIVKGVKNGRIVSQNRIQSYISLHTQRV